MSSRECCGTPKRDEDKRNRGAMSGQPVCRVVILIAVKDLSDQGGSGTHTGLQIGKAPPPGNPMRRFQLPLLGSNQDSPDPEGPL